MFSNDLTVIDDELFGCAGAIVDQVNGAIGHFCGHKNSSLCSTMQMQDIYAVCTDVQIDYLVYVI
jgi:hypothetical protein